MTKFKVHGINYKRTGKCDRCPENQPAPCCSDCVHFKIVNGKNTCLIYDKRHEVCKECSEAESQSGEKKKVTHQVCIDFPTNPWLWVVKKGLCNYKFKILKDK
jgi:hypothetical protein